MRHTLPILLLVVGGTAACTTGPGITPVSSSPDVFVIVREGTVSVQQSETLANEARAEADTFCDKRGAALEVIDTQTAKNWNVTGNVPVYKMRFRCVPRVVSPTQAAQPMAR